ncbi:MAG: hypothetical protein RLZZ628_2786, partial [Bacteroidota bacterium]
MIGEFKTKTSVNHCVIFVHSPNGNVQLEAVIPLVVGKNSRIITAFQLLRVLPLIVKNRLVMREETFRKSRETRLSLQDFENVDALTDVFALISDTKIQHFSLNFQIFSQ